MDDANTNTETAITLVEKAVDSLEPNRSILNPRKVTPRNKNTPGITEDWITLRLKMVVLRATAGTPMFDREGNEIGRRMDGGAAVRALELLGKRIGYFPPEETRQVATSYSLVIHGDAKGLEPALTCTAIVPKKIEGVPDEES